MKYVIANWKMNFNLNDIEKWYHSFKEVTKNKVFENIKIIIAPTSLYIPIVKEVFKEIPVEIAAQDLSEFEKGAHTGYVGAYQIKDFCDYSIIGHSERQEPIEDISAKRDVALRQGIIPIVCFSLPEQVNLVYNHQALIVWEDPDNISKNGVYRQKNPEDLINEISQIKESVPENAQLLYGGSVNRDNIKDIASIKDLSGVLVGNASLDPLHFFDILKEFEQK